MDEKQSPCCRATWEYITATNVQVCSKCGQSYSACVVTELRKEIDRLQKLLDEALDTLHESIHGYDVYFERTNTGYSASAPRLPGCGSVGETLNQCKSNMNVAIEMHLAGLQEDEEG